MLIYIKKTKISQGMVCDGDILIPKAKETLSGCLLSWIHEITGF